MVVNVIVCFHLCLFLDFQSATSLVLSGCVCSIFSFDSKFPPRSKCARRTWKLSACPIDDTCFLLRSGRVHSALFGQSWIGFSGESWNCFFKLGRKMQDLQPVQNKLVGKQSTHFEQFHPIVPKLTAVNGFLKSLPRWGVVYPTLNQIVRTIVASATVSVTEQK